MTKNDKNNDTATTVNADQKSSSDSPVAQTEPKSKKKVKSSRAGASWIALIFGAIVGILLLIFIVQNVASTDIKFLTWEISLPLDVAILFAAIAGAIIMGVVGGLRMYQLRRQVNKAMKQANTGLHNRFVRYQVISIT